MRKLPLLLLAALVWGQLVSWVPPHAQLGQIYIYNATHFVLYLEGRPIYLTQVGLVFNGSKAEAQAAVQYLMAQCRYVAFDVHNATSGEWMGDIYCTKDGTSWLWLRWLPLRFAAYRGYVEFVRENLTVATPIGVYSGYVPAGWYLDRATKAVVRLPSSTAAIVEEVDKLQKTVESLKSELEKYSAQRQELANVAAQLRSQLEALEMQKERLAELLRQKDGELSALSANLRACLADNEALRNRLEELERRNRELAARIVNTSAAAPAVTSAEGGQAGGWPIHLALIAAVAAVGAALLVYKRRSAE
ncbi:hypothetical protein [Pyrobaculum neutrophilum]|uniref:DUF7491 domain-containing protein n=1 Tax=Pyrobaculum neutrophilum (strain DSM 2338 / JCM 9278 / NBRC 100436 / V24Sta) TaxID=444157 RepID=B1Y8R5_PYRNV|nr:hypothetical protein [Pyrobaculum neutrophilum]ACB40144.1 conserved hypothetical protein [Pyrobaculum neutrophilum V24Sta]